MVESEKIVIANDADLEAIFKPDITGGTISDKLIMPRPGDGGKCIRFLYAGKDANGQLGVINVVKNDKFTKGGKGFFMNVEEIDHEGIQLQMGLGESTLNSIKRMCNSNGWKIADLPGKVAMITANYYDKIKCSKCSGKGCAACENTGKSTVFNVQARLDLMQPTAGAKKTGNEF